MMREGPADVGSVRRVHVVVLTIPLAIVVPLWILQGAVDAFTRIFYLGVVVGCSALLVGLVSGRLAMRTAGRWVLLYSAVILVGRLWTWEMDLTSRPEGPGLIIVVLAWFGVAFALAFLVYDTRRGAVISIIGYALLYLWAGLSATGGMLADTAMTEAAYMAGAHAALIAVVWALAHNIEHLSADRDLLALAATTDPLTGIANRRRLDDELHRLVSQARRYGHALSAVLVDLDQFKDINDTYGHDVGDGVLMATVERMVTTVRDADVIGRWGGEEFLVLAPYTDHAAACGLAERCRDAVARSSLEGYDMTVTASFGVATLKPDDDARTLILRADLALYTAKREGRNRVVGIAD